MIMASVNLFVVMQTRPCSSEGLRQPSITNSLIVKMLKNVISLLNRNKDRPKLTTRLQSKSWDRHQAAATHWRITGTHKASVKRCCNALAPVDVYH